VSLHLDRIVEVEGHSAWAPRAFAEFSRRRPLHAVDSRGFPWTEIDFPEDYWRACAQVLPAIESSDGMRILPSRRALNRAQPAQIGRGLRHV
jgi:hypothetical protein